MKKKRRTKGPDFAKIGDAIVKVATSAKDVVKVAVLGLKKKAMAATKSPPKKAKRGAKVNVKPKPAGKKAVPTKKAGATKSKKKR